MVFSVLNFVTLMKKRKVWQDNFNSAALFVYIVIHFSLQNRLIYQRKAKDESDLNVRAIYGCKQVNAGH